jgi:hypothetical protein
MALIVVAGINMMIFLDPTPPQRARLAGGISIGRWVLVVVFGRLIAFTLPTE